ncbi:MAG: ATP-dependent DNA helicase RecG, partial [Muribaculaceae bacterium]|nr:ATP-dependent DNA helicase RecG [Muribaculaceae bacterium]
MLSLRNFDIKFVKGIGPARADILASELGIRTAYDLLRHYPTSYIDRSKVYKVHDLRTGSFGDATMVQVHGRFVSFNTLGEGAKMRLVGLFSDGTATMECVWFKGCREVRKRLRAGQEYMLFGRPGIFNGMPQMAHPEVDEPNSREASRSVRPVYPLTERLRQKNITGRVLQ